VEAIEIRQKKGSFYFTVIFLPLLVIGFAYYVFLSGSPQVTSKIKYTFFALLLYSCYMVYVEFRKRRDNKPTLIISEFSIEVFGDFKTTLYLWQDIKSWQVKFDDGAHYLILETYSIKKTIKIWSLDKTPEEIENILNEFAGKLRSTSANIGIAASGAGR
jgi:hypothetical protein